MERNESKKKKKSMNLIHFSLFLLVFGCFAFPSLDRVLFFVFFCICYRHRTRILWLLHPPLIKKDGGQCLPEGALRSDVDRLARRRLPLDVPSRPPHGA